MPTPHVKDGRPHAKVGCALRKWRESVGLTQESTAHLVGVCTGSWHRWEKGLVPPSALALRAIERVAAERRVPFSLDA